MYSEAKKLHLIEELLKITDDNVLNQIEATLANSKRLGLKQKSSFTNFVGAITAEELDQMEKDIQDNCEQIFKDDWE